MDLSTIPDTLVESELFGHEKGAFTGAQAAHSGKLECASGGTLFLDEASGLSLTTQARLLRVLQERQIWRIGSTAVRSIDVRVLITTNRDPGGLVAEGLFRADLYHRLNEFNMRVPSLRERPEDIPFLANRFLNLAAAELQKDVRRISPEAVMELLDYHWPGNVRELRNVIRRATLVADTQVCVEHLRMTMAGADSAVCPRPDDNGAPCTGGLGLKEIVHRMVYETEKQLLVKVLTQTGGNKAKAARVLQIDYKTLQNKVKQYGPILSNLCGESAHG